MDGDRDTGISTPGRPASGPPVSHLGGFTLLELMMVIAIVAILLGIGIPSYSRFIAEQRVRTAAADLQNALWRTRSEAIKLNRDVTLSPANAADGWQSGWSADNPASPGSDLLTRGPLVGVLVTGGPAGITYRASGRLRAATQPALELESEVDSGAQRRCVRVDLSGLPMIQTGNCP